MRLVVGILGFNHELTVHGGDRVLHSQDVQGEKDRISHVKNSGQWHVARRPQATPDVFRIFFGIDRNGDDWPIGLSGQHGPQAVAHADDGQNDATFGEFGEYLVEFGQ